MINLRPLTFLVLGIASVFRVALAMTHQVTAGLGDVPHFSDEEHEERLIHEALGVDFPPFLWAYYNCATSTIRVRFEHDSATTRYNTLRGFRALAYEIVYENQW